MTKHLEYEDLFDDLIATCDDVQPGLMMREPALKCRGKVFAFYYREPDAICVKLGKDYPVTRHGVRDFELLNPFKHKPPMAAWFVIRRSHQGAWRELMQLALNKMRQT